MNLLIAALALAMQTPSPEAEALGRQLAESGTLAALLPLIQAKETEELVAAHPELSTDEQRRLRATADRVYRAGRERLMTASGRAYAERLSLEDLRELVRFHRSPAATRFQSATPPVIAATMQALGQIDFRADVRAAFCAETRRLCP